MVIWRWTLKGWRRGVDMGGLKRGLNGVCRGEVCQEGLRVVEKRLPASSGLDPGWIAVAVLLWP